MEALQNNFVDCCSLAERTEASQGVRSGKYDQITIKFCDITETETFSNFFTLEPYHV